VLLQGEETSKSVAPSVEDEGGQKAGRSAVAIVVGVDVDELLMHQAGDEGGW
jgi:hypothetical protein